MKNEACFNLDTDPNISSFIGWIISHILDKSYNKTAQPNPTYFLPLQLS